MTYSIQLIKQKDLVTNKWSGGLTTEIAIYPEDAVYSKRNFIWRISSAKVELERSTFTSLIGYDRLLMSLEGHLKLNHENHHRSSLNPFDVDAFSGAWQTSSEGRVTDFNVIFKEGIKASLFASEITGEPFDLSNSNKIVKLSENESSLIIYCYGASFEVTLDQSTLYKLSKGDTLLINTASKVQLARIMIKTANTEKTRAIIAQLIY
jgi:environmental stress-induced protein Ves